MLSQSGLFEKTNTGINDHLLNCMKKINDETVKLFETVNQQNGLQPIHADLHLGNIIWDNENLSIIDFDDCGFGLPIQDLAISLFYMRQNHDRDIPLLAGYNSITPFPEYSQPDLELLIASRTLTLVNYLLETTSAEDRAFLPTYLGRAERRLDHYFETGEFLLL